MGAVRVKQKSKKHSETRYQKMINPAPHIRRKLFELLNNQINYNGQAVPVYEGEGSNAVPIQILIADYTDVDESNKYNFGGRCDQIVEVVSDQPKAFRKSVDDVGEMVMRVVQPTVKSDLLSSDDFSVMIVGRPSLRHLTEEGENGSKIVRLIMRYSLLIHSN
jgi:hypothetical protein